MNKLSGDILVGQNSNKQKMEAKGKEKLKMTLRFWAWSVLKNHAPLTERRDLRKTCYMGK